MAGTSAAEQPTGRVTEDVRVFLVDDHELVRRGMEDLLVRAGGIIVIGEAATFKDAVEQIPQTSPDVAVVDLRLGEPTDERDGVELCRQLRAELPGLPCVILTGFPHAHLSQRAHAAGIAAVLLKSLRGPDLVDSIRCVAAGRPVPDQVSGDLDALRRPQRDDVRLDTLTGRERRLLELIVAGMSNREMAKVAGLAEKTVKNYVSHILAKLDVSRRTGAAAMAARAEERSRADTPGSWR